MDLRRALLHALLASTALSAGAARVGCQAPATSTPTMNASTRMATRADLERLQTSYEQLAASTAYGERTRAKARAQAEEVRRRLREGDMRVGDLIIVRINGGVTVDDTLPVLDGRRLQIPGVRQVELEGVLRAELATKVSTEVREIVREATVTVRPLTRIAVFGAVSEPGYFAVPSETTLDQLITLAGGPTDAARPEHIRLLRGETVVLQGAEVMEAISQGRTLDGLDTREGDVLEVVRRDQGWTTQNTVQVVMVLVTPLITFLLLR
jgi:protein involved in polysaccharide export with SLBB domain